MKNTIERKDIIQGTPEWKIEKLGKISASQITPLLAVKGLGAGADTFCLQLIAEELTQEPTSDYNSWAMEWGNEWEPHAREIYHNNINKVREIGGFQNKDLWYSPDGIVDEDPKGPGLIEIKCPQIIQHLRNLASNTVLDQSHTDQMQFGMMITGRKWCDFVSFYPHLPEEYRFKLIRVYRDEDRIKLMTERIEQTRILLLNWKTKLNILAI